MNAPSRAPLRRAEHSDLRGYPSGRGDGGARGGEAYGIPSQPIAGGLGLVRPRLDADGDAHDVEIVDYH